MGVLGRVRGELPVRWRVLLGVVGLAGVLVLWLAAAASTSGATTGIRVPSPTDTWDALADLKQRGFLADDLRSSGERMLWGYGLSVLIGVVVGVSMGAFPVAEGTLESPIGFLRYIPASALTPLLILWMGLDEAPKITLIVVGTVFFNILMVADVVRNVPLELVKASYTLGAGRLRTTFRVILPHSLPGMIDVARINLAAGWLMLVVAELLAAEDGLAYRINQATRTRRVDQMFALLIVFGVIGVLSDLALRALRRQVAPWSR
jgi:NitT/TauT family transport system permease protein